MFALEPAHLFGDRFLDPVFHGRIPPTGPVDRSGENEAGFRLLIQPSLSPPEYRTRVSAPAPGPAGGLVVLRGDALEQGIVGLLQGFGSRARSGEVRGESTYFRTRAGCSTFFLSCPGFGCCSRFGGRGELCFQGRGFGGLFVGNLARPFAPQDANLSWRQR